MPSFIRIHLSFTFSALTSSFTPSSYCAWASPRQERQLPLLFRVLWLVIFIKSHPNSSFFHHSLFPFHKPGWFIRTCAPVPPEYNFSGRKKNRNSHFPPPKKPTTVHGGTKVLFLFFSGKKMAACMYWHTRTRQACRGIVQSGDRWRGQVMSEEVK